MNNKAIELLYHEHDVILKGIEKAETLLATADLPVASQQLHDLLDFFSLYGDRYHHQKEEEVLFKVLGDAQPGIGNGIVGALEDHHAMFRENILAIREAIDEGEWSRVKQVFLTYLSDLRDHISAENDELFVTAEMELGEEELEKMYFAFLDKDAELGEERKQALENQI